MIDVHAVLIILALAAWLVASGHIKHKLRGRKSG